jgi:hypothetical protein
MPRGKRYDKEFRLGAARLVVEQGYSRAEASTVFQDPLSRTIPDPLHSDDEDRFVILGQSDRLRLLVVVFTERGENIRIISSRRTTRRERRDYEEGEE